ncbi:M20 metallopeptidase family protein [Pseudonocardia nigra]|uniref:M20 metallopeptidase family protein n=1 Tax=Pseudonocardia nigra TaxID=1921578 RepID=UPI001C5D3DE6|nr:M20 family metallopeptidase [Pseudonocardia nigra]
MRDELVRLRHRLHAEPELGLHLPRTQEKVLEALDGLPLEVGTGTASTSVTAVLRGARPGGTVLLRGDMDALPVAEKTGVGYASRVDGAMHACGHDLHTTMLAGAAHLLAARRDRLAGDVVFMFQPGEEGHDGAASMIAEGVLDAAGPRVDAAYGLHVMSAGLAPGSFRTRRGPILAASDTVRVVVHGAGGHGSAPHRAKDPIAAACEMVPALQTFVTRHFDVFDPVVVTVGAFHAGTQHNVIPDEATFEATVRSFSPEAHRAIKDGFVQVCRGVAAAHGVAVDVDYADCYPVTVNDAAEAEFAVGVVAEVLGEERVGWSDRPYTGSEDFSRVLDEVPGAFVALGAAPREVDWTAAPNNHSPLAVFDDAVLPDGAAVYAELAARRLLELEGAVPARWT